MADEVKALVADAVQRVLRDGLQQEGDPVGIYCDFPSATITVIRVKRADGVTRTFKVRLSEVKS